MSKTDKPDEAGDDSASADSAAGPDSPTADDEQATALPRADVAAAEDSVLADDDADTAATRSAAASTTVVTRTPRQGVAWLALFLALLAVAAIGYSLVSDWRSQRLAAAGSEDITNSLATLGRRVAAAESATGNVDSTLAELAASNARLSAEVDRLQEQIDERLDLLGSLPPRMKNLENSMATLQGVSAGARDTWLLAEAEYYMQIANAQLQLAGNPQLAMLALGMADERIQQLANPGLTDVRRALADELAALEVMNKPDIEGVTLTLASLARVVGALPLRREARAGNDATAETGEEASGFDRFWNSVKSAFSGLVRVTPPEQATTPLIAPDAEYFLRSNLALQLQAARLALVRGEQAAFDQSLDDAAAWLREYFDLQSAQVDSALETISEIRAGMFAVELPDISGSLGLLRQYTALTGNAQ